MEKLSPALRTQAIDFALRCKYNTYPDIMKLLPKQIDAHLKVALAAIVSDKKTLNSLDDENLLLELRSRLEHREHLEMMKEEAAINYARATKSQTQKEIAKKPRIDSLQALIIQILKINGEIDQARLLVEIRNREGGGTIEETTEDKIFFIDSKGRGGHSATISGLKFRLRRAKKILGLL